MRQLPKKESEYSLIYKNSNGGRVSDPRYYINLDNECIELNSKNVERIIALCFLFVSFLTLYFIISIFNFI